MQNPSWYPEFTNFLPEHCDGWDGPCENIDAHWCHAHTYYENERQNWHYLCDSCELIMKGYWDDQWQDVAGGI